MIYIVIAWILVKLAAPWWIWALFAVYILLLLTKKR